MARASRKTPRRIDAIREDLAAGLSPREIAKKRGLGRTTIQRWIADLPETKAAKKAAPPSRADRANPARNDAREADPPSNASASPIAQTDVEAILREPRPEGLDDLRERLGLLRGLLLRLEAGVEGETFSAVSYVALSRYTDELSTRIVELTPPAPIDPETDPDNVEGEKILVARLERLVVEAEERHPPCPACGRRGAA